MTAKKHFQHTELRILELSFRLFFIFSSFSVGVNRRRGTVCPRTTPIFSRTQWRATRRSCSSSLRIFCITSPRSWTQIFCSEQACPSIGLTSTLGSSSSPSRGLTTPALITATTLPKLSTSVRPIGYRWDDSASNITLRCVELVCSLTTRLCAKWPVGKSLVFLFLKICLIVWRVR